MAPLPVDVGAALLTSIGNEFKALLDPANQPLANPDGFLADPDTPPASQIPLKALGRYVCRQWARREGDSNNPAADRAYGRLCGPYLDSIDERPEPGEVGPPFSGGQCPEPYLVTYSYDAGEVFGSGGATILAHGPIGGIRRRVTETNATVIELFCRGVNLGQNVCASIANTGLGWYLLAGLGSGDIPATVSIDSIGACGADNCGNPPPEYKPPRPPITLPPITPIFIDLPDIGELQVDVNFFPDATFSLCSENVDTCVTIDPTFGDGGGGGGVGGGDLVPDGGTADSPADTGNGGAASGEAPEGQELVGIRVEVLESPIGVNTYDRVAVTVFRGIGYVRMGYPGRLALDMGGAAVISPQFFLAPVRGLTAWEVRANNGFIARVTPYYRELPS